MMTQAIKPFVAPQFALSLARVAKDGPGIEVFYGHDESSCAQIPLLIRVYRGLIVPWYPFFEGRGGPDSPKGSNNEPFHNWKIF